MFLTISGEFGRYWNNTKLAWKGLVIKLQGGVYLIYRQPQIYNCSKTLPNKIFKFKDKKYSNY